MTSRLSLIWGSEAASAPAFSVLPHFKYKKQSAARMVAFCFSMTIGVLWEFVEYFADNVLLLDMQKDTVIHTIRSVALDPTMTNTVMTIDGIADVIVNGESLGLGGYLDIGLHDTMEDLLVNFIGAVVFCTFGFFYLKGRGKGKFVRRFVPTMRTTTEEEIKGE